MRPGRRAAAGFVLTAAGMLASRLGVRRSAEAPEPEPEPEPLEPDAGERAPSSEEIERARSELSEELARRSARDDG
jgi:hypothetical protein